MLAYLKSHLRFVRTQMILLAALPITRFLLEISGVPMKATRWVSMTGLLVLLIGYLPYKLIRRSFGNYWSLWVTAFFCLTAGYATVALLVLVNHFHPMSTFFAQNSGAPWGYDTEEHVLVHFFTPLYTTPMFAVPATLFYFVFRRLRRTIGGGRYTG